MKKRIAHIAGGLTTGGVEAVIYNYFSKIDRKDYELYYITYDTPDPAVKPSLWIRSAASVRICR